MPIYFSVVFSITGYTFFCFKRELSIFSILSSRTGYTISQGFHEGGLYICPHTHSSQNAKGSYYTVQFIYYFTYFPTIFPSNICYFFPVGLSLLIQHFQQTLLVLKFLLSPGLGSWQLEFKSLIIVIVRFQNFVCCLVWAVYLGVQITN